MKFVVTLFIFWSFINCANAQNQHLKVGDRAPDFTTINHLGDTLSLNSLLQQGPLVLTFYRGEWCPYCNKYLARLDESYPIINELGANLMAVTPEIVKYTSKMADKMDNPYSIIPDTDYSIIKLFGLDFELSKKTKTKYKIFGINIPKHNGADDYILPIPATFVINTNGEIIFQHVDENYKERAEIEDILAVLKTLKEEKREE